MPAEILSQFYGQSEKQLAEMFRAARNCPEGAVVFLDEIDAIGAARNRDGASEPSRRVLTQLLQELDGIHGHPTGMLFLAATNEPWLLDDALLRPPRFTEKCYVPLPDTDCRRVLLQHRFRQCPLEPGFDLDRLVGRTEGYSGADLINLCERAKMIPYRESITSGVDRPVTAADFEDAFRRVRPSVFSRPCPHLPTVGTEELMNVQLAREEMDGWSPGFSRKFRLKPGLQRRISPGVCLPP